VHDDLVCVHLHGRPDRRRGPPRRRVVVRHSHDHLAVSEPRVVRVAHSDLDGQGEVELRRVHGEVVEPRVRPCCGLRPAAPKHGEVERGEGDRGSRKQHVAVQYMNLAFLTLAILACAQAVLEGSHFDIYERGYSEFQLLMNYF
jgi:hypothetical protein